MTFNVVMLYFRISLHFFKWKLRLIPMLIFVTVLVSSGRASGIKVLQRSNQV